MTADERAALRAAIDAARRHAAGAALAGERAVELEEAARRRGARRVRRARQCAYLELLGELDVAGRWDALSLDVWGCGAQPR